MTFSRITINMTGPVCGCLNEKNMQPYSWGILQTKEGPSLYIACLKCKIQLTVPTAKFVATFNIEGTNTKVNKEKAELTLKKDDKPKKNLPSFLSVVKEGSSEEDK